MMNEAGLRRTLPDQSSGSGHTFDSPRHPSIINPIVSKRVCFYKSGDPQFSGLRMAINSRTFKTFDALLDSLSKKVPLPFGVRNITTPRGVHGISTLDELEDGKSYICSDSHKVIPIDMALARKKMPPWYHVRPVSARRHNVQQGRFFPGRRTQGYESMALRTPKRLVVFRNGEPTVKHSVLLHKKTTPSYESILDYISELMQVHVVKLHTPYGRRIDGLPGLIMCSGTVVAVGREAFRPALYITQESPAPAKQHANRMGSRNLKVSNRKKKPLPYSSRNFSASSEQYIIHQIHNTIAENSCDLASNRNKSVELESNRILESVAETEADASLGNASEGHECSLPNEDNIEKSFRVNQDGSMTVEMKVRLTIKEEETIHWTTTLTRSSVTDQLNVTLPEPEAEQEICSAQSDSVNSQSSAASIDTIDKDKTKDNDDDDPPSLGSGVFSNDMNEEDDEKIHTDIAPPLRPPTPGCKKLRKQRASVESIKSITPDGVREEMVGSYSYTEQTESGTITERYCRVKENTTRPVPKPRRLNSVDGNSRNVSAYKSAGISQTLHHQSSEEEITERVLHIYEQQTCQDNFLANVFSPVSGYDVTTCQTQIKQKGAALQKPLPRQPFRDNK
ncbi:oxygen-regulated protein 1-like [Xenentodon cancila]